MLYNIIGTAKKSNITVVIPGADEPLVTDSNNPNWDAIVAGAKAGDASIADLFDVGKSIVKRFERLSERVTVADGKIYFDGDEAQSSLANQIIRFLEEGEDFQYLVNFYENIAANPCEHSREQLFDWLQAQDESLSITPDGLIAAYKGVGANDEGVLCSIHSGRAIVDGEPVTGRIPNRIGSTVEMPRSDVQHDPSASCSTGLHVGTFDYAKAWAREAQLLVHVNPRDVVSVPTDAGGKKVRVSRYVVVARIDAPVTTAVDTWWSILDSPQTDSDAIRSVIETVINLNAQDDGGRRVWIDYTDRKGKVTADREVSPIRIESDRFGESLLAYDHDKDSPRKFKLSRIDQVDAI